MIDLATCKLGLKLIFRHTWEFLSCLKHGSLKWAWHHLCACLVLLADTFKSAIGNDNICPICGWQGRCFFHVLSAGNPTLRPNALCPSCGALTRHRDTASWLKSQEKKYSNVLIVAPDPGLSQFVTKELGCFVVTTDIERPGVMVKSDLHNLGFTGKCFDLIVCSHVLEHVRDDIICIGELYRVLKTNAIAILPVPFFDRRDTVELVEPDESGHRRKYGRDYFTKLRNQGLVPISGAENIGAVIKNEVQYPYVT